MQDFSSADYNPVERCRLMSITNQLLSNFAKIYWFVLAECYTSSILFKTYLTGDLEMDKKKDYTKEELLEYIKTLEKTIKVQHETINRMLDAYILNTDKER